MQSLIVCEEPDSNGPPGLIFQVQHELTSPKALVDLIRKTIRENNPCSEDWFDWDTLSDFADLMVWPSQIKSVVPLINHFSVTVERSENILESEDE